MSTRAGVTTGSQLMLRRALFVDILASGAVGVLLAAAAPMLDGLLGLPLALLREAGLFLLVYVAFVVYVATRNPIPLGGAWIVIAANVLWTIASFVLLLSGWVSPTTLGLLFVAGQALVVAALGLFQYLGVRAATG